ncbi:MAG: phosphatidylglycerophosphatase A, partial [Gammaproteobacteria bacterium]|nr:phosphatidylglycerophosphatase A [Gammaproteobacteria bacterium]
MAGVARSWSAVTTTSQPRSAMGRKSSPRVPARAVLTSPFCLLAFGLGVGLAPFAPGTFGTLLGVPLYWALADQSAMTYGGVVLLMTFAGVGLCAAAARILKVGDHPGIVWDEIVGFLITMWGVPFSWSNVALGFLLFRLFDVVKPWPVSWADRRV